MPKWLHSSWYLNILSHRCIEVEVGMRISAGCWLCKIWGWSGCAFSSKLASRTTMNQLNDVQESLHSKAIFSPQAEVLEPELLFFFTKKCSSMKAWFVSYNLKDIWVPISCILFWQIKLSSYQEYLVSTELWLISKPHFVARAWWPEFQELLITCKISIFKKSS